MEGDCKTGGVVIESFGCGLVGSSSVGLFFSHALFFFVF